MCVKRQENKQHEAMRFKKKKSLLFSIVNCGKSDREYGDQKFKVLVDLCCRNW